MTTGLIFDIKHYAIHDGPGIRMTVFMKGCPLACTWCHNPESISSKQQKMFYATKCIGCAVCVKACPNNALSLTEDGIVTDYDACQLCGICTEVCPTRALEMTGRTVTVKELIKTIEKERVFFDQSGGGVTVSGGEPLAQPDFLLELLQACGEKGLHRVVDTSGQTNSTTLLKVAEHTEHFLFDLKHMDPVEHKKWTGIDNRTILENLSLLAKSGANITIRIPLIKGVNSDEENLEAFADFISSLDGEPKSVDLLPFHNIAISKHKHLNQPCDLGGMAAPSPETIEKAIGIFKNRNITASTGG